MDGVFCEKAYKKSRILLVTCGNGLVRHTAG